MSSVGTGAVYAEDVTMQRNTVLSIDIPRPSHQRGDASSCGSQYRPVSARYRKVEPYLGLGEQRNNYGRLPITALELNRSRTRW